MKESRKLRALVVFAIALISAAAIGVPTVSKIQATKTKKHLVRHTSRTWHKRHYAYKSGIRRYKPTRRQHVPISPRTAVDGVGAQRGDAASYGMAHAKALVSNVLIWIQDHDSAFPVVRSSRQTIFEIAKRLGSVRYIETLNPKRDMMFHFNVSLSKESMDTLKDPPNTPILYDRIPWPDGRYLVAFADSHVAFVRLDECPQLKGLVQISK